MEEITLVPDLEINIGLDLSGYRLIPGCRGTLGLPVEAFLRLYAVDDKGNKLLIARPGDLAPLVRHINSEDEAWKFLRLFTSPKTHYLFQTETYIIDMIVQPPGEPAGVGTISPTVALRLGYQPPLMMFDGHNYIATRDLVRADAKLPALIAVLRRRESLSEDVIYRLIEDKKIGELEPKDVYFPSYE